MNKSKTKCFKAKELKRHIFPALVAFCGEWRPFSVGRYRAISITIRTQT